MDEHTKFSPPVLSPIDFSSEEITELSDYERRCKYFKRLQEQMYRRFNAEPGKLPSDFSSKLPFGCPTDNTDLLKAGILESLKDIDIGRLLTVMGFNFAEFFREIYPSAIISIFDNNPHQFALSGYESAEYGTPYMADITNPPIRKELFSSTKPDLLYLSNIPDFMDEEDLITLADDIAEEDIKAVVLSENIVAKAYVQQYEHEPVPELRLLFDRLSSDKNRYELTTINAEKDNGRGKINTFHILKIS